MIILTHVNQIKLTYINLRSQEPKKQEEEPRKSFRIEFNKCDHSI